MGQDASVINTTIDRSQHTVLVVDDDPALRYATARMLRAAGFQTVEAGTGGEAVSVVRRGAVSAVVLDVHLPDIDGFEVCRTIRSDARSSLLPIIHLSAAYVQNEDKVMGLDAGADAYLVHPAEPAVLVATLQALVRARMAEDSLRRSDIRFRAIYSQALSGIALLTADGKFADANPALVELLGRAPEALVGRAIGEFAPSEWRGFVADRTIGAMEGGKPWQGEFPLVRADGRLVHLEWSISSHVEPNLRIAIAADISDRVDFDRRRQEMLEREQAARTLAERHSRTKDDFVAVLSHELRTPLNAIAGWVHILNRKGAAGEFARGLEAIDRNVKAQARIISDILDVSRINSGKLRLEREDTDPVATISDAIEALQSSIEAKRLSVTLEADPSSRRAAWLDPTRFQQIFWNLMTNAIKFSKEGGSILVSLGRHDGVLELSVRDAGIGISEEFLPHLFDRFSQSDPPDNRFHGGLGLGLSIVKHLAEMHGGRAEARSAGIGAGATMRVTLDVARPNDAHGAVPSRVDDPAASQKEQVHADCPLAGLRILVVEDNADASEMLRVVLSEAGADVRVTVDYEAAVSAASEDWPDVLISDIGLPGKDGYELIQQLRRVEGNRKLPHLQAIAFTAFSRPSDRARALDAGFDDHLPKPLQPHLMISTIVRK